MPIDPADLRGRDRRIAPATQVRTRQPESSDYRVGSIFLPVIIRSTREQVLAGNLQVQRIRYTDSPPVVGALEGVDAWFTAYPYWGEVYSHYTGFAWGPDDPIPLGVYPFLATRERDYWVLVMPLKVASAVLDSDAAPSGCNFG